MREGSGEKGQSFGKAGTKPIFNLQFSIFNLMKAISWKKVIEIVIAVLTAIIGTLSVQSCL